MGNGIGSEAWLLKSNNRAHGAPQLFAQQYSLSGGSGSSFPHLDPNKQRYEGVDGRCYDRTPGGLLYRILGVLLLLGFGLRSSHRLIVKGENRAYLIPWQILTPLYFLSPMIGWGLLADCAFYFAHPCSDIG